MDFNTARRLLEMEALSEEHSSSTTFTANDLKKAYYKAALKHHPDRDSGNTAQFQRVGEAYQFLSVFLKTQLEVAEDYDYDYAYNYDYDYDYIFPSDYNTLLQNFLASMTSPLNSAINISLLKTAMLSGCKQAAITTFEGADKSTALKMYDYLEQYAEILAIDSDLVATLHAILKEKMKDDTVIILNPTLENILACDIFKLEHEGGVYRVPLWHEELSYDLPGGDSKSLIVKCVPTLLPHILIDQYSGLHVSITLALNNVWTKPAIRVEVTAEKVFEIPVEELMMKKKQTYTFMNQGITLIDNHNIFNTIKKGAVYFHLDII
jgi:curved DNA-binding protein CbpA